MGWRVVSLDCEAEGRGGVGGTILVIGLLNVFGEGYGVKCESESDCDAVALFSIYYRKVMVIWCELN